MPLAQVVSTIGSLVVGGCFFTLWFWLLPGWLGFHVDFTAMPWWKMIVAAISVLGFSVAIRCVWDFGATGRGTPAPFLPPQKLVVVGFYRFVRNPMYVGFFTGWIGLWICFGHASRAAIVVGLLFVLGVHLFVTFYEEPTLRRMFGADYDEYCKHVGRWIPRFTPWSIR